MVQVLQAGLDLYQPSGGDRRRTAVLGTLTSLHPGCAGRCLKYRAHQYHEPAVLADRPQFEDLYRAYLGRIYAYVRAQVHSSADAEDITAQVFMNAYQAYARFEARNTTPAAWLFRIARNATLDPFPAHASGRRPPKRILRGWPKSGSSTAPSSLASLSSPSGSATRSPSGTPASASKTSGSCSTAAK